ncbi:MAG: MFS transporter [Trichodesmium sp. St16_bin4-tuft]|nr:MFS transporter [Trichodesmium sp. St5_bin8]MDE5078808.1 MFS transporter [Trichodesmium sp. St2_bin6]MDE5098637.1 MFS transporter [Trichodesmium sp. St16_bin4-tuft]MDE5101878.1 MFS transporter [Trichodesmium sp. St19_bin2]
MKVFKTLDPKQQRSLMILFLAGLLFWSSITTLLPTLPLYLNYIGGTKQQIGFVLGCFSMGLLLSRFILAPIADTKSRKLVLIVGTSVAGIAPLGYLLFKSFLFLMLVRAFHGISIAGVTIGYTALVADLSPPGRRGELIGYMSLCTPIGMAIGPTVGGFLVEANEYVPLFIVCSTLGIASLLCSILVSESSAIAQKNLHSHQFEQQKLWQILGSRRVLVPVFVMLIVGLIFGTTTTFLPLYIQENSIALNAGIFYTVRGITNLLIRIFTGRASDKFGRGVFISSGLVFSLLGMLTLWTANSRNMILLAAILGGSSSGLILPMMITLMTDRCPPDQRGKFFSLCIGGFDVGIATAGPTFGLIAEQIGYRSMFAIDAILASIAIATFITLSNSNLPHSIRFAFGRGQDTYAINH